jgi:hypothetical protein
MTEKGQRLPIDLKKAFQESGKLSKEIYAAYKQGKTWQAQAKWIGLDGYAVFCLTSDFCLLSIAML